MFIVIFFLGRYCFPFGRPEGALKATLSLLERVSNFFLINHTWLNDWWMIPRINYFAKNRWRNNLHRISFLASFFANSFLVSLEDLLNESLQEREAMLESYLTGLYSIPLIFRSDYSHAAPFKVLQVAFRACKYTSGRIELIFFSTTKISS